MQRAHVRLHLVFFGSGDGDLVCSKWSTDAHGSRAHLKSLQFDDNTATAFAEHVETSVYESSLGLLQAYKESMGHTVYRLMKTRTHTHSRGSHSALTDAPQRIERPWPVW